MRLLRCLDYFLAARDACTERDTLVRFISFSEQINLGLRMFFDHLLWLLKAGVTKGNEPRLNYYSNLFWFWGLVMAIVRGVKQLQLEAERAELARIQKRVS